MINDLLLFLLSNWCDIFVSFQGAPTPSTSDPGPMDGNGGECQAISSTFNPLRPEQPLLPEADDILVS